MPPRAATASTVSVPPLRLTMVYRLFLSLCSPLASNLSSKVFHDATTYRHATSFPSAATPRLALLTLLMTQKTIPLNFETDTGVAQLPGPPVSHLPADFRVPDTSPHPAVRRKPSLEAANEDYRMIYPRAFSKSAQEEFRAGNAFEQKVWVVLSLCSAVTILYAAFCFFMRR